MHHVQLTVDDGWHGQHYPVPVIDDWPHRLVSDDWQVGPQMAVTLYRKWRDREREGRGGEGKGGAGREREGKGRGGVTEGRG